MSATSGITIAQQLAHHFASAVNPRFIKVSINNEQLQHDTTVYAAASFQHDLLLLPDILEDNVPAYILAKVSQSDWLLISYVPDAANVRNKMLYASTRASLLRELGSNLFTDAIFATSKADLTPDAYAAHRRHVNAPKPLSAREQEMADVRAAEAGGAYEGSRARVNHIGTGVGLRWSDDLEDAVKQLAQAEHGAIVVIQIDTPTETLHTASTSDATIQTLATLLPPAQPCYALFAWPHQHSDPPRREIVFIYSCPSDSPIKDRMVYSSGVSSTFQAAKSLILDASPSAHIASRKIETSDPKELDEAHLKSELGLDAGAGQGDDQKKLGEADEKKPFARPRGPIRKR
ncbi:hypothetical protein H0H92_013416 [Tricholoma furcatifolium]|nr:hypothetical protein H0H92_013416 [Tricholoma furcatifolium]